MEEQEDSPNVKDKIAEKIGDIIYEKAKEEVKSKIRASINNAKQKVRSFFSLKDSKKQKIDRISTEITEKQSNMIEDNFLGIIELYSIHFVKTIVFFLGIGIKEIPAIEPERVTKNEN